MAFSVHYKTNRPVPNQRFQHEAVAFNVEFDDDWDPSDAFDLVRYMVREALRLDTGPSDVRRARELYEERFGKDVAFDDLSRR